MEYCYNQQDFPNPPHWNCFQPVPDVSIATCPVPPIPDLIYPEFPITVITPAIKTQATPQSPNFYHQGNSVIFHRYYQEARTLPVGGYYSPLPNLGYFSTFTPHADKPKRDFGSTSKRGRGRSKLKWPCRRNLVKHRETNSASGSKDTDGNKKATVRIGIESRDADIEEYKNIEYADNLSAHNIAFCTPKNITGKKRGRKPGSGKKKMEASGSENNSLRQKSRRGRRRQKFGKKKRKYRKETTDIIQLTLNLANALLSDDEDERPESPDLSRILSSSVQNFPWSTNKLEGNGFEEEKNVTLYNDLIEELAKMEGYTDMSSTTPTSDHKNTNEHKETTRSTAQRVHALRCRSRSLFECHSDSQAENDDARSSSTDTWNSKVGGKCTNKWQHYQKYVLGNRFIKRLREERQTERLIKVLCSTPQRTLRSQPGELDNSQHDSTLSSLSPDKSNSSWISLSDTSGCANTSIEEKHDDSVKQGHRAEAPKGYFNVDGGVCPDITPTIGSLFTAFSTKLNEKATTTLGDVWEKVQTMEE